MSYLDIRNSDIQKEEIVQPSDFRNFILLTDKLTPIVIGENHIKNNLFGPKTRKVGMKRCCRKKRGKRVCKKGVATVSKAKIAAHQQRFSQFFKTCKGIYRTARLIDVRIIGLTTC